ncbi:hypothetical protein LS72_009760, partial [Helicobacter apodemus]
MKNESNNFSLIPNSPSSTLFLSLSLITALNTSLGADSWATSGTINISNSGTIDTITNTSGVNNKIIGNQAGKTYNDLIINNGITLQNNGNGNTLQLNNASAGTIENQGLIKKQNNSSAVAIENNATLGTFKNTGTIEAVGNAVNVYINKSTLTDFSNSG